MGRNGTGKSTLIRGIFFILVFLFLKFEVSALAIRFILDPAYENVPYSHVKYKGLFQDGNIIMSIKDVPETDVSFFSLFIYINGVDFH